MSAQIKIREQWEVTTADEALTAQSQEHRWQVWRKRLVSIWEAVWYLAFGAKLLRYSEITNRFEEVNLQEQHRAAAAIAERII